MPLNGFSSLTPHDITGALGRPGHDLASMAPFFSFTWTPVYTPSSLTSQAFDWVTNTRNRLQAVDKCTQFMVKCGSELCYAMLALVGVVEGVAKGVIALTCKGISCCVPEKEKKDWAISATFSKEDACLAIKTSVASIGALVFNFTRKQFDLKEAFEGTLPCLANRV